MKLKKTSLCWTDISGVSAAVIGLFSDAKMKDIAEEEELFQDGN